jgi:hypothetical protein
MLRKAGASPITVEFQMGGQSYTTKKDYVSDGIEVGDAVCVVFDARKPSRCFVIWNERPAES